MSTAAQKPAILIVDDEPDVLLSLRGLLRRDFEVHTAQSGAEALEIMSQYPVHVIMTDQRMPSMTGVELMHHVRSEHPEAIRIIFTGYADIRAVVEAINSGELYRYITKPWDPDDLLQLLREAVGRHDEMAAQATLLRDLGDYLDDASQLAAAHQAVASESAESLQSFQSRTDHLRALLHGLQKHHE
ncbi:MAG: response regulator [Planctomycetaceae bacterium]